MSDHRLGQGMQLRAEQQMLMRPEMRLSLQVLQLAGAELEALVRSELEINEALLVAPRGERARTAGWEATERHDQLLQAQAGPQPDLADSLEQQLSLLDVPEELEPWVRLLIRCLDEHGYLSPSDAELLALARAEGLEGTEAHLGRSIAWVQRLEPRGVGGRDLVEALLLQLDPGGPEYDLLCRLIEEFLGDLARNRLPLVAKRLGLGLAELEELLTALRRLDPRPGAGLCEGGAPLVRPEVVVEEGEDGYEIRVENSLLPTLAVDAEVVALAKQKGQDPELKKHLREKVDRARWLVEAVGQRRTTLLRLAQLVFDRQAAFLVHGPGHLRPLSMTEVAQELGRAVSTVSRTVAGKYAQTPWGVFPLRHFFQTAVGDGEGPARDDLRERVRRVFEEEDRTRPLSDDEVAERLSAAGVTIARRTVAKYRKELGVPSSYRRRQY